MRDYRKALGFTSANATKDYLSAKDIKLVNWQLVELYNARLIDIFNRIQSTLPSPIAGYVSRIVNDAYFTIRNNDLLMQLSNHGRGLESVYYSWMQGYIAAVIFKPLIERELNCVLSQNGADDLNNPQLFAKKSDPDLVDHDKKIFVEMQAGFKGGKTDIKRSKINPKREDYAYYIVCLDCFNGQYCILSVRDLLTLPESVWYNNPQWEGALCYTIPDNQMKSWSK